MNQKNLFRQEVLESRKNRNFGSVSINTPIHYQIITIFLSSFVFMIFFFIVFGEFSEKYIVKGYLESTKGVTRVFPTINGVITQCFIKQGDSVKKGDKLYKIDTSDDGVGMKNYREIITQFDHKKRVAIAELNYKRRQLHSLKELLKKKYIPLSTYNQKHDELVALHQLISSIELDLLHFKHSKSYIIHAPIDGKVSSLLYQRGQYTNVTKPLLKLLPADSSLLAQLYIPVSQSGFIERYNKAIIRYDAYPYARFGSSTAIIQDISKSSLTDDEEEKPLHIGKPYYKSTALLNKQYIRLYGIKRELQNGMTITAVIVGSKRKLWQWILDPLYSFYGGVVI